MFMKEATQKLSLDERATQKAVEHIYMNSKAGIGGHFILALFIPILLMDELSLNITMLIFLSQTVILTGRTYIALKYHKIKDSIVDIDSINHWLNLYKWGTFMTGLAWGITFFFLTDLPIEYDFILFAIIIGAASAGLLTLGVVLSIYLSFILPMFGVGTLWMFLQNDTVHIVTGLLTIFATAYYYHTAYHISHNFKEVFLEKERSKEYVSKLEKEYDTFETLFEKSPDGVLIMENDKFIQCNQKIVEMLHCNSKDEVLNTHPLRFCQQFHDNGRGSYEELNDMIIVAIKKGFHNFEWICTRANNEDFWVDVTLTPINLHNHDVMHVIWRDISARKRAEQKLLEQKDILDYQAHHDALTELPNRILFNDRLEQGLEKAKRKKMDLALLFIDLDHFKQINDSLGHATGDKFLKMVTQRLKNNIRKSDTLARVGGDEFTIIMEDISSMEDSSLLAQKILNMLVEPFDIDGRVLYMTGSIGISLYPQDGENVDDLLKYADTAMYKAKDEGRNNFQFYSSDMTELALERVAMKTSLREAIKNEEFVVYFQKQLDASIEKTIGMEALVRWQHPSMGLLSPIEFINLAEETGMIIEIDNLVMKMAMEQISAWYKEGLEPGMLALNLTMQQLESDHFIQTLQNTMQSTDFKPEWLELEITEGQVMKKPEEAIVKLNQINALGIKIAIDDFGTGYSSLSYLKRFPINKLKIDQSFIRDIPHNDEDVAIVKAIIALAQSLNLDLLAEGVETMVQKEFLLANGCKNIQGYYYARPMPAEEMEKHIQELNIEHPPTSGYMFCI